MSAEEWKAASWWVQRAYLEGLQEEGILSYTGPGNLEGWELDPVSADLEDYRKMGLTVIDGG